MPEMQLRVLLVCGTRPEAIKMAPLALALTQEPTIDAKLCVTGQHRSMLDQVLALFELTPDFDLDVMRNDQDLTDVTVAILTGMRNIFKTYTPDLVLVHGDTSTTFSTAIAAFYAGVAVCHVEAGLRTGNMQAPWPEEANRRLTSVVTERHYAPTTWARDNLLAEGIPGDHIVVTGNTVIDALKIVEARLLSSAGFRQTISSQFSFINPECRLILVTGHRRENHGKGLEQICTALAELAKREDVQIIYPVHLNPSVQEPVNRMLASSERIYLLDPLDYIPFVYLMSICYFVISDSGGIQEEAPALGKPVLLMRETTERPEAVDAGTVRLVGTEPDNIVAEATLLLDNQDEYQKMSVAVNPYGNGDACKIIAKDLVEWSEAVRR